MQGLKNMKLFCIVLTFSYLCNVKRLLTYSMLLLVLTTIGCSRQRTYNHVLAAADAVIEQDADSADTLLREITDVVDHGDEASRAYYILLKAEAAHKRYQPVPNDSLLRAIVSYYERTGNKSMLCRAIYYRAMPCYEQGLHNEALLLLKKGEELAVRIQNRLYMAKYHESLCMVNYMAKCDDLMLKYAKLFLDDAIQLNDSVFIARAYDHIAVGLFGIGKNQEAEASIQKTLPLLQTMDSIGRAHILTNIGCIYHRQGDLSLAKRYLGLSLTACPRFNTYVELGDIYADEGDYQKAEEHWNKALSSDNPQIVINTLSSILNRYKQLNDYTKALAVSERIYLLKDSLHQASEQTQIAELQYKYDRQVVEKKLYKALTWVFGLALLLILLSLCYVFYHRHTVKAFTNQLSAKEEAILNAQRQIALLENSGEEHTEEIRTLQRQITNIRKQTNERLGIGKELYDRIAAGGRLSPKDDLHCLIEYYSILRYEVYHIWNEEYKGLTTRDYSMLILRDMGKTEAETEQSLSLSHNAFRAAKSRLKSKQITQSSL